MDFFSLPNDSYEWIKENILTEFGFWNKCFLDHFSESREKD